MNKMKMKKMLSVSLIKFRQNAEEKSKQAESRGRTALEQGARDVILSLNEALLNTFKNIVNITSFGY